MKSRANKKFAIVTQVAPPQPSGQSVLFDRLLRSASSNSYSIIYTGVDELVEGTLTDNTHHILPPVRIGFPRIRYVTKLLDTLYCLRIFINRILNIVRVARIENSNVLIGCSGDLLNLPATWIASCLLRIPFVVYVLDDYVYQWTGHRRRIASFFEKQFIGHASRIIVLNEFVQRDYAERYGVKPIVLHNPVSIPSIKNFSEKSENKNNSFVNIVYTGSVYHAHFDAFTNLIAAIARIKTINITLHIYTSQPFDWLESHGIVGPKVEYHGHVPQEEVFSILRKADILFLPLALNSEIPEVIRSTAPFKMSEYLAIGRPILVHVPPGSFLSWYFKKYRCGAVVDSDDVDLLSHVLKELIQSENLKKVFSENARSRAEIDFNLELIGPAFFETIDELISE